MRTEAVIDHELIRIWKTMLEMHWFCHSEGILPGGLNVRRAFDMHQNLIGLANYDSPQSWLEESVNRSEVSPNLTMGVVLP
jgi:L-serine dehydratase